MTELLKVCDPYFKHIKFDKKFFNKIQRYRINWINKSPLYSEFLGSNLLGVHPIRFSSIDDDLWFTDLLGIEADKFKYDIHNYTAIDKTRKVTSNIVYISIVYIMHRYLKEGKMHVDEVLEELYYIFAYKVMGSLLSHYFKHDADISIAKATNVKLSNKFILKKTGSWNSLFRYRSDDVKVSTNGLHVPRLRKLTTLDAEKVIADLQGRLRDTIKAIYRVFMEVIEDEERVKTTTIIDSNEDDEKIKSTTSPVDLTMYIKRIIKKNDFINDDIIYLLISYVKDLTRDDLVTTLKYLAEVEESDIDKIVSVIIEASISYLRVKGVVSYNEHIVETMTYLRHYFASSSVKNHELVKVKHKLMEMTQIATGKRTRWKLSKLSINTMLYIFIRAIYRN